MTTSTTSIVQAFYGLSPRGETEVLRRADEDGASWSEGDHPERLEPYVNRLDLEIPDYWI